MTHIDLDLEVDFAKRQLVGQRHTDLDRKDKAAAELWLDTRDLTIEGVTLEPGGAKAKFELVAQARSDFRPGPADRAAARRPSWCGSTTRPARRPAPCSG